MTDTQKLVFLVVCLVFGAICFVFTLFRNAFGQPEKRTAFDWIALVGLWLCPVTWGIFLIVYPAAALCDYLTHGPKK